MGPAGGTGTLGPAVIVKHVHRPPLAVGVYCITAVCGMLDAASFLGLGLIFVETMTGNILLLSFSLGVRRPTAGSPRSFPAARSCRI